MKLYSNEEKDVEIKTIDKFINTYANENLIINDDMSLLDKYLTAYESINLVHEQICSEEFNLINKTNYVLYNEYIKTITVNLNVNPITLSQENINTLPSIAINHYVSLEGLVATMWEKIKELFTNIYTAIKKFFTTYFTRLGRVKSKLQNLKEAINETDKDIKNLFKEDVPGSLSRKYPVSGDITINTIEEVFTNVNQLTSSLIKVNKLAVNLANKEILDRDFVSSIKNIKDKVKYNREEIDKNNKNKSLNPFNQKNKDNRTLKQTTDKLEKEATDKESEAVKIGNSDSNIDVEINDEKFIIAKKEFSNFIDEVSSELIKIKNKQLVNGLIIKEITIKEEEGIEFVTENKEEEPSGINLASKTQLIKLINNTIKMIESIDDVSESFIKVNDTIMANVENVEKIIKDIDSINLDSLGKYKTVLTNKVRERLKLMKTFFSQYNKINKSLYQYVLDTAEGNIEYTILSLKNFN